ncbi:hypothetical protein KQ304_12555 [Synechococcus sp. CS-1329]|uniref:hypothetical protein n=1 Tax=Synechococcus sp. CS-1329 TaxID=2847975 RepID=UPI00223ADDBE|nr:hypothetical protein [Synechococcus sp. CS-1329]MCT0219810.1 hypothetical protein [Synechococcus sp. CS-1329]
MAAIEPIMCTAMRNSRFGYSDGAFIPKADLLFVAERLCRLDRFRNCLALGAPATP